MDHGFNNATCFLWFAANTDGRLLVYDEYYLSGEVVSYHAGQIKERNAILGVDPDFIVGDPSIKNTDPITGTSIQAEYAEQGVLIACGNNNVIGGINRVARMFESGQLRVTNNCEKTLWELHRYRWGRWSSRKIQSNNNPKDLPQKKDDHAMDALRYGVASRFSPDVVDDPIPVNTLGVPEAIVTTSPLYGIDQSLKTIDRGPKVDSMLGDDW